MQRLARSLLRSSNRGLACLHTMRTTTQLSSLVQFAASPVVWERLPLLSASPATATIGAAPAHRSFAAQARQTRGVPQGAYAPSAVMANQGSQIKVTLVSSNLLAEPYKGDPPPLPFSAWFTPSGWKQRWSRWLNSFKSIYTLSKIRRNIKGFALPAFKEEALGIYNETCSALAAGDRTRLRQLVSPTVFTDMKRQLKAREDGGWKRVTWSMATPPTLKRMEVVQGRLMAMDPKNDDTAFAQLTVRFRSGQRFAAYDNRGRLVAGNEDQEVEVVDHWVFERALRQKDGGKWRVAGRLSVPVGGGFASGGRPSEAESEAS